MRELKRSTAAGRFAALLLMSTCLAGVAAPARADGGNGGAGFGGSGGPGGADSATGAGGTGGNGAVGSAGGAGGGGGAGITGGTGGNGGGTSAPGPGSGGPGGATPGSAGQPGGVGNGGGGGGGGAHGSVSASLPVVGTTGGSGGAGGNVNFGGSGGGGGGAGGYGAVVTGAGPVTNTANFTGGAGGVGGTSAGSLGTAGNGGSGGVGLAFTTGASLTTSGTIQGGAGGGGGLGNSGSHGGDGGVGGTGLAGSGLAITNGGSIAGGSGGARGDTVGFGGTAGSPGAGGAGIAGSGLTIVNNGSITGGLGGDGTTRANAITFTGGVNTLTLGSNSTITGNIAVTGSVDFSQTSNATLSNAITGTGSVSKSGAGTLILTGANSYGGGTTVSAGILQGNTTSLQGNILNNATVVFDQGTMGTYAGNLTGTGSVIMQNVGTLTLTGNNTFGGGLALNGGTVAAASSTNLGGGTLSFNGGTLQALGILNLTGAITLNSGGGTIDTNGNAAVASGVISGSGGLTKNGNGVLTLQTAGVWTGGTTVNAGTLVLDTVGGSLPTGGALTVNGGLFDMSQIATGQSVGALAGSGGQISLGANNLTTNSSSSTTLATQIIGTGALIKQGSGVLTLTGNNTFSGGTNIQGGLVNFNALNNFGTGNITLSGGGLQWATGNTIDPSSRLVLGAGGGTFDTNGNNVTMAGGLSGTGGLTKQGAGLLNLTGNSTYTGPTAVNAGTLSVNGSITSNVTVGSGGTLGGNGTIFGTTTIQGTLAPGNSIGTLNVNGNFTQAAGSVYQVEANAQGQSDKIVITGTATIQGGTVQALAQAGTYATSTTYTILTASGGRTGTYSSVTSNFAFLTPSLSYDANNAYLTLALLQNNNTSVGGFLNNTYTINQKAVGYALNQSVASASGDFATVIGALANLTTQAGPWALNQISGQPYADFGTFNVANNALFMNALGQQMAVARGSAAGSDNQRQALAEACETEACEGASPFSVWGSVLGGVGSAQGDGNSQTFTYNVGGAAAGVDYRLTPNLLVGVGTGYTNGTQWVDSFQGKGWSNSVSVAAYGSFTQWGAYVDALAGYAYSNNQLQRQLSIPGLQPRTANGSTGANQFLGQVETGYAFGIYAPANATVTPFARFQASSINQAAFQEWGANSLSLNVAQQTTTSLRTTLGAELDGAISGITLGVRLGWMHEYADTSRPITAAFAGAPSTSFTVYGATPQRDAAVIGFQASTNIATATQVYLRYDGDIGSGTDNHALNAGLRLSF